MLQFIPGGKRGNSEGGKKKKKKKKATAAHRRGKKPKIKGDRHTQTNILDSVSDLPNVQGKKVPGKTLGTRPYGRIYAARHFYGR